MDLNDHLQMRFEMHKRIQYPQYGNDIKANERYIYIEPINKMPLNTISSNTIPSNTIPTNTIPFNTIPDENVTRTQEFDCNNELKDCDGYAINCFLCQQRFTDIDALQQHFSIHMECSELSTTQKQHYNCDVCGRYIPTELELQKHHKRYHATHIIRKKIAAGKRFKCEQCNDVYVSLDYLEKHIKMMHGHYTERTQFISEPQLRLTSCLAPRQKQKYPPRSPFFNPNLWIDYDAYI